MYLSKLSIKNYQKIKEPEAQETKKQEKVQNRLLPGRFSSFACLTPVDTINSIQLAKTFQGEFVPQDFNDEPSSGLLEGIRAEWTGRENQNSKKERVMKQTK